MNVRDLSGAINGLLTLTSILFAIFVFLASALRDRESRIQIALGQCKSLLEQIRNVRNQHVDQMLMQFDQLSIRRFKGTGVQLIMIFVILSLSALIKAIDSTSGFIDSITLIYVVTIMISVISWLAFGFLVLFVPQILLRLSSAAAWEQDVNRLEIQLKIALAFSTNATA